MTTNERFIAFAREMERAALGTSPREEAREHRDMGELLLTIADVLHGRGDIHGAIEQYQRAMRVPGAPSETYKKAEPMVHLERKAVEAR